MQNKIRDYIEDVLALVPADSATLNRLRNDLGAHISDAAQHQGTDAALLSMGSPGDLAKSINDGLFGDEQPRIGELLHGHIAQRQATGYEFKSQATLFGLPLVHINLSHGAHPAGRPRRAKGIIAIGDIATGGVALGGIAAGVVAVGGVGIGLLSLGGVALGLFFALGGCAIGQLAIGGCALGVHAIGGAAVGLQVAVGGVANAPAAIGGHATGEHVISGINGQLQSWQLSSQDVGTLLRTAHPNMPQWIISAYEYFAGLV